MSFPRSNKTTGFLAIAVLLIIGFSFSGCFRGKRNNEEPLAKAYGKLLYPSDLKGLIPSGSSSEDSLTLVKSYIELWLKKRAVVNRAEYNLTAEQKNLDDLIEEYRTSLLIYNYEKLMVAQNLDTVVSRDQINNYFLQNSRDFILRDPIVKGLFFRIARSSGQLQDIRDLAQSPGDYSYKRLVNLGAQYADVMESFDDNWTSLVLLMQKMPGNLPDPERFLKQYKFMEAEDAGNYYFIRILDFKLAGEQAPIEYVENEIRDIILNKRKMEYIRELEESIYNEAVLENQVEVYENK